jgi:hypothetical protein
MSTVTYDGRNDYLPVSETKPLNRAILTLRPRLALDRSVVKQLRDAVKILNGKRITVDGLAEVRTLLTNDVRNSPVQKGDNKRAATLANTMVRVAKQEVKCATTWDGEATMFAMSLGDAADHLEIACLLYEGKVKEAGMMANDLDTGSRDEIPDTVWDYMMEAI